jgi:hypothetical protein
MPAKRVYLMSVVNDVDFIVAMVPSRSLADEEIEIVSTYESAEETVYLLAKVSSMADKLVYVTNPEMIPLWVRKNMG